MNKSDYLARLQTIIKHLHNCADVWHSTVLVHEVFQGEIAWEGDVEVFELTGHSPPAATRCYGWANGTPGAFITILQLPRVHGPQDAVRVTVGNHP